MSDSVECQIFEVPVNDNEQEENDLEEQLSPAEEMPISTKKRGKKPGHKKPISEEMRAKLSANLAKAREVHKKMREQEAKNRDEIKRKYNTHKIESRQVEEEDEEEEERIYARPKPKGRKPKTKFIVEDKPKRQSQRYEEDEEDDYSSDWSDEEPVPRPRGGKGKVRHPKEKKISEKEMRLMLLEKKLDEIISHTKKTLEKPRTKTIKSNTTIIQAPKEQPATNPQLKKAAQQLLSLF